jgi:hypothetical protein
MMVERIDVYALDSQVSLELSHASQLTVLAFLRLVDRWDAARMLRGFPLAAGGALGLAKSVCLNAKAIAHVFSAP